MTEFLGAASLGAPAPVRSTGHGRRVGRRPVLAVVAVALLVGLVLFVAAGAPAGAATASDRADRADRVEPDQADRAVWPDGPVELQVDYRSSVAPPPPVHVPRHGDPALAALAIAAGVHLIGIGAWATSRVAQARRDERPVTALGLGPAPLRR